MRIRYIILAVFLLVLAYFLIYDQIGINNRKKAKLVRIGMTSQEVIEIMGDPKTKGMSYINITGADSIYSYQAPFASSEGVLMTFNKAGKVIHIANE